MFDLIKAPLSDLELYHYHYLITYSMILIWGLFGILGFFIQSKKNIIKITYFLIGISAFQEIFDYTNRFFINDLYAFSKCDYIIGVVSTFTLWASFFGNVPLCSINKIDQEININSFKICNH